MAEKECPVCHYTGTCPKCKGSKGGLTYVCATCGGSGKCPRCGGAGVIKN
jgi:hypothetical protein